MDIPAATANAVCAAWLWVGSADGRLGEWMEDLPEAGEGNHPLQNRPPRWLRSRPKNSLSKNSLDMYTCVTTIEDWHDALEFSRTAASCETIF